MWCSGSSCADGRRSFPIEWSTEETSQRTSSAASEASDASSSVSRLTNGTDVEAPLQWHTPRQALTGGAAPESVAVEALTALATTTPTAAPGVEGPEQESDLMERVPRGENRCDAVTNCVPLVSLGCYCGPKLSFQRIGRGAETLPFDWIRTTLQGILRFLRTDFEDFFTFETMQLVPGCNGMTMYRSQWHSFWHDDPTEPSMRAKYGRRIERFNQLDARQKPILFVRVVASTTELAGISELMVLLLERFGPEAHLLVVLCFQFKRNGPLLVAEHPRLLVYFQSAEAHAPGNPEFNAPFAKPVLTALDWAVGRFVEAATVPTLEQVLPFVETSHFGNEGLGGLRAFEGT